MLKRVEILCLLKRVRGFAPYGWTNVRQRHLTCVGFGKGHFNFKKLPLQFQYYFPKLFRKPHLDS